MVISVGDIIFIKEMYEEHQYDGKYGVVEHIDDMGNVHGSWGGLSVCPRVDKIEVVHCNSDK